jgi:transposase-like protein
LRDSTVERPQVPIEAEEIEFQDYLLDGLRGGSIDLPQYGRVYSHLFFDGLYQILSRLVVGRGAKHLRPALKRYFNLRVFSVERFSQYLPIRRLGVAERRGLLEVGRLLLEEWPDRFVTFSKSHKVTVHTSISRDSETPYWLFRVIKDHLTSCKYVHVVTDQEIRSVIGYLKGKGIEPTYTNLCKYIHKNAVYAFLSKNNLVWQTVRQKCPCCRREAVQVRSRLNSDGRRLYKCQSCKRLHLYDTAPHKYPQDFREQAIKLCQAGNGTRKVAAMLSIFRGTVKRWWREHKNSI